MPRFESGARKQAARTGTLPEGVMSVFEHKEFDGHEQVVFCHDPASGLRAIIAIHNTNRGPALGGCRMWHYASEAEALTDVLRSEERRVGKECVSTCRSRGSPANSTKIT